VNKEEPRSEAVQEVGINKAVEGSRPEATGLPESPALSDDALALRFTEQHPDMRYTEQWGKWHRWDGTHWCEDRTLDVFDLVRKVCRSVGTTSGKFGIQVASGSTVSAVERLARSDRRHAAVPEIWDADPMLLGTPSGTVNLQTGQLVPADRNHYITKMTAVAPSGECPTWQEFLDRITDGNVAFQAYLQRAVGYALTGSTKEQVLFFFWGTGANGKSTFLNTISKVLGELAKNAPMSAFTANSMEQHPTDLAMLHGARLVTSIETEEGRRWAEARIKALTGGDPITARFMRQDFFTFTPTFKVMVAGNHKPKLNDVDEAIRRRIHLVPLTVTIPANERDQDLQEKLEAELGGILAWAIEGCLAWQREGLNPPQAVLEATNEYLAEEDAVALWIEARCEFDSTAETPSQALYKAYKAWMAENGDEKPVRARTLTQKLKALGCESVRIGGKGARGLKGILLRTQSVGTVSTRSGDTPIGTLTSVTNPQREC
jgi:putative DNA primase/helicase